MNQLYKQARKDNSLQTKSCNKENSLFDDSFSTSLLNLNILIKDNTTAISHLQHSVSRI